MRVLILGANGMLGHVACRAMSACHDVFGACRSTYGREASLGLPVGHCYQDADFLASVKLRSLMQEVQPDVVVNCVGIVKQKPQAVDPIESIKINALLPHELGAMCDDFRAKLIHISTDCVFSGQRGMYRETDLPDPVDLYGRSKLLGEITNGVHLTLRTSLIGRQLSGSSSLVEWALSQRNSKISGYINAIFSGVTTFAMSQLIMRILDGHAGLSGLYQVAAEPISKYRLLSLLNDKMGLGIHIETEENFYCDRSLDGSRFLEKTGIVVPSWENMLDELAQDSHYYESRGVNI